MNLKAPEVDNKTIFKKEGRGKEEERKERKNGKKFRRPSEISFTIGLLRFGHECCKHIPRRATWSEIIKAGREEV